MFPFGSTILTFFIFMPLSKFYLITWWEVNSSGWRKNSAIVVETSFKEALEKVERETAYPLRQSFEIISVELIEAAMIIR